MKKLEQAILDVLHWCEMTESEIQERLGTEGIAAALEALVQAGRITKRTIEVYEVLE